MAKVESLRLENQSGLYWLSVEEPVDNLYQVVKNFWASEGYRLVVDEPVIGLMQTEYIYPEVADRLSPKEWEEKGRPDLIAGAQARMQSILSTAGHLIPDPLDEQIKSQFNIVPLNRN